MLLKPQITCLFVLSLIFSVVPLCMGDTDSKTVVIFKEDQSAASYSKDRNTATLSVAEMFMAPAFVGGMYNNKEFFAVLFTAMFEYSDDECYTDVVVRTSHGNYTQWTAAEIITNVSKMNKTHKLQGDIAAVMKDNKIYVLATSIDTLRTPGTFDTSEGVRDPLMVVGIISSRPASKGNNDDGFIKWEPVKSIKNTIKNNIRETEGSKFIGGQGNGIATTNGTIIFPIVLERSNSVKMASILYSNDDGSTWHIGGETEQDTGEGSLVECSDRKLLFSVASEDGYRKVFESDDMGKKWQRSLLFYGVWGNDINRGHYESQGSVIKVPVDNKDVFLFSHPLNKKGNYNFDILQLWMSDGQRIMCVGTISDSKKEYKTGNSILAYVNEHLYVTHQINPFVSPRHDRTGQNNQWKNVIGFTPLPEFFEVVKTTVRDWQDIDDFFNKSGIPTKSLVGVLGNTTEGEKLWTDMYNCVNATVKSATRVDGGFRFDGQPGSGAKWPVASQGQNQLYMFTEKEFTLTATVTVHDITGGGDVFVLGASADDDGYNVPIGIGYSTEKKWFALQNNNNNKLTDIPVKVDTKYQVTITFANETGSVYLDGDEIASTEITLSEKDPISHFFIGRMDMHPQQKSDSCTVKNVMLFSRALSKEEIIEVTKMKESSETYKKQQPNIKPVTVTERKESNENSESSVSQESQESVLKTVSTSTHKNSLPVIKTEPTSKPQKHLPVSATESTITPASPLPVIETESTSKPQKSLPVSATESTITPASPLPVIETELTSKPQKRLPVSATESTITPARPLPVIETESTSTPENVKLMTISEPQKAQGVLPKKITNAKTNNRKHVNMLSQYHNTAFLKDVEGDKSAAISLSAVAWVCVACSLIALIGV